MDLDHLNSNQWNRLLSLLSLDTMTTLYQPMGLALDSISFLSILRRAILDGRKRYNENPEQIPRVETLFIELLDRELNANTFLFWSQAAFLGVHSEQPELSAWDIVFLHWAFSRQKDLYFLRPELRSLIIDGYTQIVSTDDLNKEIESLKSQALSDWDLEMFSRHGYDIHGNSDPYLTAKFITKGQRLRTFVSALEPELAEFEKKQLHREAENMLNVLGVWMERPIPQIDRIWEQ